MKEGKSWRCRQAAALALDARIDGQPLSYAIENTDRYGRDGAVCHDGGGDDIYAWLIREGRAL